jgi:hypothetical protein
VGQRRQFVDQRANVADGELPSWRIGFNDKVSVLVVGWCERDELDVFASAV